MQKGGVFGGVLLVSGTTIGAAMLAVPVSTGVAGFFPAIITFLVVWAFLTYTAFLMLEVTLWMDGDENMVSMAKKTLGRPGKVLAWIAYLFLLYSLATAYLAGSIPFFIEMMDVLFDWTLPTWAAPLPFLILFGSFVYKGARTVDAINRILMLGLTITFFGLLFLILPEVNTEYLKHVDFRYLPVAISVVVTSFGFHIIIPSLTGYMKKDIGKIKKAIGIGSVIPLFAYLIWEFAILGIVPIEGKVSLNHSWQMGESAIAPLKMLITSNSVAMLGRGLLFFAIFTSFLGVALSLSDFLADGLKIEKNESGRLILCSLTFIPPLIIALTYPRAFLSALEYAGAFGVVILLGILPALMVWKGRYHKKFPSDYRAPGGKVAIASVIILGVLVIFFELLEKCNLWVHP